MLTERQAHMIFEDAVADFPETHINARLPNCPYTFWHLLEHLRICQHDILEYIRSDHYTWPTFPDDLWPDQSATTDLAGWNRTVEQFLADQQHLVDIINDPAVDLFAPLPNSGEYRHTILREINCDPQLVPHRRTGDHAQRDEPVAPGVARHVASRRIGTLNVMVARVTTSAISHSAP